MTSTSTSAAPELSGSRYLAPGRADAVFNRLVAWLVRRGVSVAGARRLSVRGRSTGEMRTTVVNLLDHDGERFLVAPRGHTQWVRNLRAAGEGTLTVGQRRERFRAEELADADKGPVLAAYLDRWAWEVGRFFEDLSADSDAEALAAAAPDFPVFRVVRPG